MQDGLRGGVAVYYNAGAQLEMVPHAGGIPRVVSRPELNGTFAIDATSSFYQDTFGTIFRKPKATPNPIVTIVPADAVSKGTSATKAAAFAADAKWFYWASGASIHKIVR